MMEIIEGYYIPIDSDWKYKSQFLKQIIKVRFVESKAVDGKIGRDMKPMSASEGKVININLAAFIADTYLETVSVIIKYVSQTPITNNIEGDLKLTINSKLGGREYTAQTLFKVYQEPIWLDVGQKKFYIPKQDQGQQFVRYANIVSRLVLNKYLE